MILRRRLSRVPQNDREKDKDAGAVEHPSNRNTILVAILSDPGGITR
jgi:hypothetical protein